MPSKPPEWVTAKSGYGDGLGCGYLPDYGYGFDPGNGWGAGNAYGWDCGEGAGSGQDEPGDMGGSVCLESSE